MSETSSNKVLTTNIKRLRTEKRITQEGMAKHLGVDRTAYSKMETGKNRISAEAAAKIAEILKVEVADLYGEDSRKRKLRTILKDIDDDVFTDDDGNPLPLKQKDELKAKVYDLLSK